MLVGAETELARFSPTQAKWVQERGEQLMAAISPLAEKMVITWEEDVRECKASCLSQETQSSDRKRVSIANSTL